MHDKINHPDHYTWLKEAAGIEVIDIARHMDFDLGSALKYILRAGRKHEEGMSDDDKRIEDLKKARWYLDDEIARLGGQSGKRGADIHTHEEEPRVSDKPVIDLSQPDGLVPSRVSPYQREKDEEEAALSTYMDVTREVEKWRAGNVADLIANLAGNSSMDTSKSEIDEGTAAPSETEPGDGFIDLGLSVKWLDCNVAWDVKGKSWRSSYKGYEDCALAWPEGRRVPTWEDFHELISNCRYEWAEREGVRGGLFTSKRNGNSVFFPADGYYPGEDGWLPKRRGEYGYYWSSTLDRYNRRKAICLVLSDTACRKRSYLIGKWCFPIRLVQDYEEK